MPSRPFRAERGFTLVDTLAVVAVVGLVIAMALPVTASSMAAYRFRGDGQGFSNAVGLAKMRAGARFSRARIYVDLAANTYSIQTWDKTAAAWVVDGGVHPLSRGVTFGFGALTAPPPNSQAAIGQSPACTDDDGDAIANTSCIVFNSRGIPITAAGAPTGGNAIYITDGSAVYAVTITATPLIRFWWSPAHAAAWVEQQ
jgi:Tfp pilus assembly protein FimT